MITIEIIIEQYGAALWRLATTMEFDRAKCEDLYQNMLIAIWQALPKLREQIHLKAYIFRIARNRAISHLAYETNQQDKVSLDFEVSFDANPITELLEQKRQQQLLAAIQALPLGQREVIALYFEGFSYAEIAEVLQISENNVGVRINRAGSKLSEILLP